MIIGNGLLANSLRNIDRTDVTFFCSGVSNSLETRKEAFQREIDLLMAQPADKLLVYFSTVSIYNPAKQQTPYILHKFSAERLIRESFPQHIILRLPNMIGAGGNGSNLFPYFLKSIAEGTTVTVYDNTHRELMEADLLPEIVDALLQCKYIGSINAGFGNATKVLDIYLHLCMLMEAAPNMTIKDGEDAYEADCSEFTALMKNAGVAQKGTWQERVERYVLSYRSTVG
jgi:nucleoside-diphosphate-sugar epimerase